MTAADEPKGLGTALWGCEECDWWYQGPWLGKGDCVRYCVYCGKEMEFLQSVAADEEAEDDGS